jgi:hypothetical protein
LMSHTTAPTTWPCTGEVIRWTMDRKSVARTMSWKPLSATIISALWIAKGQIVGKFRGHDAFNIFRSKAWRRSSDNKSVIPNQAGAYQGNRLHQFHTYLACSRWNPMTNQRGITPSRRTGFVETHCEYWHTIKLSLQSSLVCDQDQSI